MGKEHKVSELLDDLNSPEWQLTDEKEEEKRIGKRYKELENSIPFSQYKEEFDEISKRLEKLEQSIDRLEYFVRGLNIADVIQKLEAKE